MFVYFVIASTVVAFTGICATSMLGGTQLNNMVTFTLPIQDHLQVLIIVSLTFAENIRNVLIVASNFARNTYNVTVAYAISVAYLFIDAPYGIYAQNISDSINDIHAVAGMFRSALTVFELSLQDIANQRTARLIVLTTHTLTVWGIIQILLAMVWVILRFVRVLTSLARYLIFPFRRPTNPCS